MTLGLSQAHGRHQLEVERLRRVPLGRTRLDPQLWKCRCPFVALAAEARCVLTVGASAGTECADVGPDCGRLW